MQLKNLEFAGRYVTDNYKTQRMSDKALLESGGKLEYVADRYKNQQISGKGVNTYRSTIQFVPEC